MHTVRSPYLDSTTVDQKQYKYLLKKADISGLLQFRPMLFKDQLHTFEGNKKPWFLDLTQMCQDSRT